MAGDLTVLTHRRAPGWLRGHVLAKGRARGGLRARCQCNTGDPQHPHLGRIRDGLRVGVQEVRRLGRQPDDGMACPLWRSRRDDLLACRKGLDLHFLATQALFVFGGRRDDQGRAATTAPTWRFRANIRQPWPERRRRRFLPPARVHLPPRPKAIARQKLAPSGLRAELPNLLPILSNVIN